ncbi:5-(carboxyamino)imidazole ribonucleotide synthase [Roseateles saccharophilus]|uniref:N5-carboxyaminoimidazole ribonucleotide synthase n=1 Tax=Roseateles saccharophilus TaxID=304 RepID=A0A4R3U9R9_ROSSA|nr:5-(carboxyamino)imidazole ribonucleotide synthase [Roseateles saccharophilus]MDG0835626.1 5-(carboxyamino)imidazole ribonucleotide synthase [Roseateles saccharophilus]TCU85133.1 5-(carboxyamino)imidazole ribonucleotide synthase [Roseateles saccharophilus]
MPALLPGTATLGVLGGGQLGRMFVHAAQALGYRCIVLDPDAISPAGAVAERHIKADYLDPVGLAQLARDCDAITTEFENVPALALQTLAGMRVVAPAAASVAVCQDRAVEKAHFEAAGVPCAPHAVIGNDIELAAVDPALLPGILKTARMGYDGKGQVRVSTPAELAAAWEGLKRVPCVLEQLLPLQRELSVLIARGADGQIVNYPAQQNLHRGGILAVTEVPAPDLPAEVQALAVGAARQVAEALDYVGVLCIEFFWLQDGRLVVNEMAPRPHNSGHWTMNGCDVSQFELQVRALAGLPLPEPRQHSASLMLNLLGDLWFGDAGGPTPPAWDRVLALPGTHLHLYGKAEARHGRKMGHLNITAETPEAAHAVAVQAAAILGLPADF